MFYFKPNEEEKTAIQGNVFLLILIRKRKLLFRVRRRGFVGIPENQDPVGPYKNRKTGTVQKLQNQDSSRTLQKPENRDPSRTLQKPENRDLSGTLKNRKTGTGDPSETLEKLENRNPIIIIIIIFYYHHFVFC